MSHSWWFKSRQAQTDKRTRRKFSFQPQLESLEARQVPATLMVTNTADSGAGSLRQAILDADNTTANPGQNTIDFNIPANESTTGVSYFYPLSPLPALTDPAGIIVDGTSQPGYAGTPLIAVSGIQGSTGSSDGLEITGGNSTVRGLIIVSFSGSSGLELVSSNNTVQGNYIGIGVSMFVGNQSGGYSNFIGILLPAGATNNTIGGTTAAARNVISNNFATGVLIEGSGTSGNLVEGNYIGTDATGTVAEPNGDGVAIEAGATANTIGGTAATAGNVISGNREYGVHIIDNSTIDNITGDGTTTGNVLYRNDIGLNAAMTAALPNYSGVDIEAGANGNQIGSTIGGSVTLAAPLIAGNSFFGIIVNANNTVIQDSLIGTNLSSATGLGNGLDGIDVTGADNTIGDTASGQGNLISGNGRWGILLDGSGATGNVIENNGVGVALGGSGVLPNTFDGVALLHGATGNTIGGTAANTANVLSGNGRLGVYLSDSGTSGNVVEGNFIGVSRAGAVRANLADGIAVLSGANGNTLGGTASGAGNTIAANGQFGILLNGVANTLVQGNFIGTDAVGDAGLGNILDGVAVVGASDNTLGGTVAGAGNVISGNGRFGVFLNGATGSLLQGNFLGTDAAGTAAVPNTDDGVALFNGAADNTIGGTAAGARNVISGNGRFGVYLNGSGTSGNVVQGNTIGLNLAGMLPLPNTDDGVAVLVGAADNTIGGSAAGAGNEIIGNDRFGVYLAGSGTSGNVIQGNTVVGNSVAGIAVLSGANGNTLGGTASGAGNSIHTTGSFGILLNGVDNTLLQGNAIQDNTLDGVAVVAGTNNTLGGTVAGAGNVISGNGRFGVFLNGASENLLQGNFLGTDAAGTIAMPNTDDGVALFNGATDNTIGGTVTGAGNVISGNDRFGIYLNGSGTSGNIIEGNLIGVSTAGSVLGNTFDGVAVYSGAAGNTLGGTASGAGNTIAGNGRYGVDLVLTGTSGNLVQGNFIGTNAAGTLVGGNASAGVFVAVGAADNTIGGTVSGAGNVIANNGGAGVVIGASASDTTTVGDAVLGNAIHSNGGVGGLGIDLADNGATANGPGGSAHSGPNDLQNYPVFTPAPATVVSNSASATISFSSLASSTFRLEFFLNAATDVPAQGRTFVGAVQVMTDAKGNLLSATTLTPGVTMGTVNTGNNTVSVSLPVPAGTVAGSLTATATVLTVGAGQTGNVGDTSEFSFPPAVIAT